MKGDFSRRTFDPSKSYSAVFQEMGRMLTDADLEEEHRILAHRIETAALDVVGGCGGPIGNAGFEITPSGAEFQIGDGRYYTGGILVENGDTVNYTDQPYLPDAAWPPESGAGHYLVYLDIWRRLITALDDPSIREVALGGPTTSTREQTIWQVRLAGVDHEDNDPATCLVDLPDFGGTTGTLAAQADPEAATTDPCEIPPSAGFKGLENQFYRVEIHTSGDAYDLGAAQDTFAMTGIVGGSPAGLTLADVTGLVIGDAVEVYGTAPGSNRLAATFAHITGVDAGTNIVMLNRDLPGFAQSDAPELRRVDGTFVWSRDNGSVVTTIERIEGPDIQVRDLGVDDVLGFAPGQWVEITDDRNLLDMRPGQLLRVAAVDKQRRVLTLQTDAVQLANPVDGSGIDPDLHPRLRRWEGAGAIRFNNLAPDSDWIHLEDGVQVRFTAGHYRTGDYWHFPARTATADPVSGHIEWPHDLAGDPELQAPHGVEHTYCRLAIIDVVSDGDGGFTTGDITNCRNLFPELTELTNLFYVGGDGQEGVPNPADPANREVALGAPLQVRVANGSYPVAGASVRFEITAASNGRLQGVNDKVAIDVTDAQGIATCVWELDGTTPVQFCEARLLDAADANLDHQAVNFHASLSRADRVSYDPRNCQNLTGTTTVQEALDRLCRIDGGGSGGCCRVVIGPGRDFDDIRTAISDLIERGERDICLCLVPGDHELPGLSLGSQEVEQPLNLSISGCGAGTRLTVRDDLRVTGLAAFALIDLDIEVAEGATIHAIQCRSMKVDGCLISGRPPRVGLLRMQLASRIYVGNSMFESFLNPALESVFNFLDGFGELMDLFTLHSRREFDRMARRVVSDLAQHDFADRFAVADDIESRVEGSPELLNSAEAAAFRRFIADLRQERGDPLALLDHLIALRRAALSRNPGIAIEIGEIFRNREDRFDHSGTRAGDVVIENNQIFGHISLYGIGTGEREIELETLQALRDRLRRPVERGPHLSGLDLTFHVRNNRLTRLIVADEIVEALERLQHGEFETLDVLIDSFHCTDNVIEGRANQLVARHLALTSNEFSLSAIQREGRSSNMSIRVLASVADSSVFTGNHGARFGSGATFQAGIFNASRAMAEAANLEIEFL